MTNIKMISVVRNFEMYERLVKNNPFNQGAEFVVFDNNQENLGISARYNSFLDNYDYSKEAWFVFCHEDWEVKEDLASRLRGLAKDYLYGPIGAPFSKNKFMWSSVALGQIEQCDKNGTELQICGIYNEKAQEVGTFDCQCLIVHSSLVKKHHLRFDENLYFDLYVEDFCINARENYGVSSRVLQLKCCHWSFGNVAERFFEKLKYLRGKYKNSQNFYISTVECYKITKGICLDKHKILNKIIYLSKFIFQAKKTKSNKLIVKVFRIPVFSMSLNKTGEQNA